VIPLAIRERIIHRYEQGESTDEIVVATAGSTPGQKIARRRLRCGLPGVLLMRPIRYMVYGNALAPGFRP
jgi:hypothetical protein